MNKEKTLSALLELSLILVIGAIQAFLIFFIFLFAFGIFICGNEYLELWKNICFCFIVTCLITGSQLFIVAKTYARLSPLLKFSFWVLPTFMLFPLTILGSETFSYTDYYEKLDVKKWKSAEVKPLAMIRAIYEDGRFIGKTRDEIIQTLGEGTFINSTDSINIMYQTEGTYSPLVFRFRNGVVNSYGLDCND